MCKVLALTSGEGLLLYCYHRVGKGNSGEGKKKWWGEEAGELEAL